MSKQQRLGRGLDALIPSLDVKDDDHIIEVGIAEIRPNPYQPRKKFDKKSLEELCQSIKEHGIIQPLIARKSIKGYELVAGERRLRAAKMAELDKVPVVLREFTDEQLMEIGLIENLQRENLNAIEEAQAYEKLMERFSLTQEELAKRVGKSRPHVANFLRLLHLPPEVQQYVSQGKLSMGHARTLLGVEDDQLKTKLAKQTIDKALSVRQLEELVQKLQENVPRETKRKKAKTDPIIKQLEEQLRTFFGTSVQVKHGRKKGKIEIEYYSREDLDRILQLLQQDKV
ncbi:MAG: ParB/RepB/Spo0J family partition protein [Bacillaceae bacterium]|nr:ParB/RepB/Spo0J family partition protein [Bacillaceae bacterium]